MQRMSIAWLLVGSFWLVASIGVNADEARWETLMQTAAQAYQQGRYAEAERHYKAALQEAERFGLQDPRLAANLNNLAVLYRERGQYAEAEQLQKRSLAIVEKAFGPDHFYVAVSLNSLALVYKAQNQFSKAERLQQRSCIFRSKVSTDSGRRFPSIPVEGFHRFRSKVSIDSGRRFPSIPVKLATPHHKIMEQHATQT